MLRVEVLKEGVEVGAFEYAGTLDVVQHAARLALRHRDADFVRIVDPEVGGIELWSERREDPPERSVQPG